MMAEKQHPGAPALELVMDKITALEAEIAAKKDEVKAAETPNGMCAVCVRWCCNHG